MRDKCQSVKSMANETIPKLDQLLELDEKINRAEIKPLTAPGENYGSLMLSVEITTQSNKKVKFVAKTLPPSPAMQQMFNCPITFPKEIAFYKTVLPTLANFWKKHGVQGGDFVAKYLGSRLNLDGTNDKIDENGVLLLENLTLKGFVTLERTEGFDFDGAKVVLATLARLYGTGIALKLQDPKLFEKKIKPYLIPISVPENLKIDFTEKFMKLVYNEPRLEPYWDRLSRVNLDIYPGPPCREPFGTISHNDSWVNNIMVRLEDGKPVEAKIVDFQITDYASPAKDVIFFLFSSVQNQVLRQYCDSLIRYYHDCLIMVLSELKSDTESFGFDHFQKEVDFEARNTQLAQIVLMLRVIFAPRGTVKNVANLKPSDLGKHEPTGLQREKLLVTVEEFVKRNWI